MKTRKVGVLVGVAAIVAVVGAIALLTPSHEAPTLQPAVAEPAPMAPPPVAVPAPSDAERTAEHRSVVPGAARRAPAQAAPSAGNEATLMAELRDVSASTPEVSLKLAREGNQRFKDSADVPERSQIIVKSLMALGRVDEARAEARVLVEKYPDTSWAADVHRHMFVNPPSDPSERGYGKTKELE